MNIAIFASAFHPSLGGVEEHCRQLAQELIVQGNRVIILTNQWPRTLPERELFEGIPLYRIPFRLPGKSAKSWLSFLGTGMFLHRRVDEVLRKHDTQLIHVQCVSTNAYYATRAARTLKVPLVVSLHGELKMDATRLFERSAVARWIFRRAVNASNYVTGCSRQTLAEAESFLKRPLSHKASVVYNGVRIADFSRHEEPPKRSEYILGIGRLVAQKGFDVLLRSMQLLVREFQWRGRLLLAGDGPEADNLKRLARDLGIQGHVDFFGSANHRQKVALFQGASVFAMSSRHEPFGIVNLEAMACGTPVVATAVGGVPEILQHGENGLLVPAEDPQAMAQGIFRMLNDAKLRRQVSAAGRKTALAHEWQNVARAYTGIYQTCLSTR